MTLSVADYDRCEDLAIECLPNRVIEAFRPSTFQHVGYPARIRSERELHRYVDTLHELRFDADFEAVNGLTTSEFGLLRRISEGILHFSKEKFGVSLMARPPLIRSLNDLRHIRHMYGDARPRVFELGPGSGYLGALLMADGYPYAAMDVSQAFYLYQNHLWSHLFGDALEERVGSTVSVDEHMCQLSARRCIHMPWWDFASLRRDLRAGIDLFICNSALCEMHPNSLQFALKVARVMLANGASKPAFVFDGWGSDVTHSVGNVARSMYVHGFRASYISPLFNVFVPDTVDTYFQEDAEANGRDFLSLWGDTLGGLQALASSLSPNPFADAIRQGEQTIRRSAVVSAAEVNELHRQLLCRWDLRTSDETFLEDARTPAVPLVIPPERPIVVFGRCELAEKAIRSLTQGGRRPEAVIDNNPAHRGTFVEGLEVRSPESLRSEHFVVITIPKRGAEVMTQLEAAGYRRGKDFLIWPGWKDAVRIF